MGKTTIVLVLLAMAGVAAGACDGESPGPTQTPVASGSPTASPTATTAAALTPTAGASPSAEAATTATADAAALTETLKSSIGTMVYWLNVANGTPPPCGDPCERDEDFVRAVEGMLAFCAKVGPASFPQWPGYSQREHGALVSALTEACGTLEQGVGANGGVSESAGWKAVVAEALKPLLAVQPAASQAPSPLDDALLGSINRAILTGDVDALVSLLSYLAKTCDSVRPDDPGQVPCPSGVALGTNVDTYVAGTCGGGAFLARGSADVREALAAFTAGPLKLHSVIAGSVFRDVPGRATLVYVASAGDEVLRYRAAVVDDRGLVAHRYDCGLGLAGLVGPDPDYLVPPAP